jgi:hypothetical protein
MAHNLKTVLASAIKSGDFIEIERLLSSGRRVEVEELLDDLARDESEDSLAMAVYGAALHALNRSPHSQSLQELVVSLLVNPLCHYPGAYSLVLHHAREAARLNPGDVEWMEQVLFFARVPECPLPQDEASSLARKVLAINPQSVVATEILSKSARPKP